VIARTMSRLRNQLLHQPRAALCSATTSGSTAVLFPGELPRRAPLDRPPLSRSGSW
jgi:hypothetical protein